LAVSRATLIARFPEFTATPESLVTAAIADATLMVDSDYYGGKADMAITYYAAHLIATNPLGEMARIDKKSDRTVYLAAFERVMRSIGAGFRMI